VNLVGEFLAIDKRSNVSYSTVFFAFDARILIQHSSLMLRGYYDGQPLRFDPVLASTYSWSRRSLVIKCFL